MLYALYSLENRNIIEYGGVSMKIFIIEDEPAIREELVQLLQSRLCRNVGNTGYWKARKSSLES